MNITELNQKELNTVSGGGFIAAALTATGYALTALPYYYAALPAIAIDSQA